MLEKLFGSNARVKILQFLVANPDSPYYVRELTRKLGLHINAVRHELLNLSKIGILVSKEKKNKIFFSLNKRSPLFSDIKSIFSKNVKTEPEDIKELKQLGDVKLAVFSGALTKSKSKVDLLLVGKIDKGELGDYLKKLAKQKGSEVNYTIMDEKEFGWRKASRDRFLFEILDPKKRVIIDEVGLENPKAE